VKIITACVANHVEALGVGLYLQGAFPQFFYVPSVPHSSQVHFAFVAEFEPGEIGEAFPVLIETRQTGHETTAWQELILSRRETEFDFDGFPLYGHYVEHPEAHFSDEGAYEVVITMEGKQLAIARYGIRLADRPNDDEIVGEG
jgi:hypothetical protein